MDNNKFTTNFSMVFHYSTMNWSSCVLLNPSRNTKSLQDDILKLKQDEMFLKVQLMLESEEEQK